MVVVQQCEL